MAEQKVKIVFEIDGIQQSVSSVDELQSALKGVDTQAKKTEKTLETTAEAAKDVGKAGEEAGKSGEAGIKIIDEAFGGLGTKFKEVGGAFKTLGTSMKASFKSGVQGASALKKGLIATGIGALVVALGLIVAYWDDIVGAISGVSSSEKQLLADTEKESAARQDSLNATLASENSLKLAGKSEKEIRDLKIQQTNEAMLALENQLTLQKEQSDAQVKALQRNKNIAEAVIGFLLSPITLLLGAVDALTAGLAQVGVLEEGTSFMRDFTGGLAGMLFDPEAAKEEGDKTATEIENQLLKMKNTRDGYILQGQAADQAAYDKKKALDEKAAADAKALALQAAADKKAADEKAAAEAQALLDKYKANRDIINDLLEKADLDSIENTFDRAMQELAIQRDADLQKLADAGATEAEINRIKQSYSDKAKQISQEEAKFQEALRKQNITDALAATSSILANTAALIGEGMAGYKAVAIAQATIDTYTSAQAAYKSVVGIPVVGPVLAPIAAGVAVAAGIKSVQNIMKTKIPGAADTGSGALPSASTVPAFDPSQASGGTTVTAGNNVVTAGQGGQGGNVIKAYVVSSDLTGQQEKDKKINDLARL